MTPNDPYSALPPPIQDMARDADRASRRATFVSGLVIGVIGLGLATFVFGYAALHGRALMPRGEEIVPILGGLGAAIVGAKILSTAFRPDPFLAAMAQPAATLQRVSIGTLSNRNTGHTVFLRFSFRAGVDGVLVVGKAGSRADAEALIVRAQQTLASLPPYFPGAAFG